MEWQNLGANDGKDETGQRQERGTGNGQLSAYSKGDIGVGVYLGYIRGQEDGIIRDLR